MVRSKLPHRTTSRAAGTRGTTNAGSPARPRIRWTMRALSAHPRLGRLPDRTKRAIAATSRMSVADLLAGHPGQWMPLGNACLHLGVSRARVMRWTETCWIGVDAERIGCRWWIDAGSLARALGL